MILRVPLARATEKEHRKHIFCTRMHVHISCQPNFVTICNLLWLHNHHNLLVLTPPGGVIIDLLPVAN